MKDYVKASFFQRLCAYFIDSILLVILGLIISIFFDDNLTQLFELFITVTYGVIFIWKCGATPGKMLFNLKVVDTSYKSVPFRKALLRETIGKFVSSIVLNLGYLWILLDKKNQGWQDKLAKTYVVKLEKGKFISTNKPNVVTVKRKIAFWLLLLGNPLNLAIIFLFVYIFLFRPFQVSGDSMSPNYIKGEYIMSKIQHTNLNRGDVVVFKAVDNSEKDYIKRVIAIPGDKVMLLDGKVYLNDQPFNESKYLDNGVMTFGGSSINESQNSIVPEGYYFVLGDNRPLSSDSREYGFVPAKNIIGKILLCYWNCK